MGDGHELHRAIQAAREISHVELAVLVVSDDLHHCPRALGHLQQGDGVAGVLRAGGEDSVAGRERQCVERHVPSPAGVLHQRDLAGAAAEHPSYGGVGVVGVFLCLHGCLVAADAGFQLQMRDHRLRDCTRRQRGTRVVQVRHRAAARRVSTGPIHVQGHAQRL